MQRAFLLAMTAVTACSGEQQREGFHLIPPGKADNYYSSRAVEYKVRSSISVAMTAEQYADEVVRKQLVTRRLTAVALYLTGYVTEKFRGIDINDDGEITDDEVFFHNEGYGGFHTMVRNYTVEAHQVTGDAESGYVAELTVDMAGPENLLQLIPRSEGAPMGEGFVFDLVMPEGATIDPGDVPGKQVIRNFDPATHDGPLETIQCRIEAMPNAGNAYPHYGAFFQDGVFDITLFHGHDYNVSRTDLQEAKDAYVQLVGQGFSSPVASFDDLKAESGPLVREIKANGTPLRVEVRIYHSDMFNSDRKGQHDLALAELGQRDVFFYNGHAGPYYGFYLDGDGDAKVYYHEFADMEFSDKQQLFVAQGCQTYSQYADILYANKDKSEENLDVITTVNYSYGKGTLELLRNLIRTDAEGNHEPADYYTIVGDLNNDWTNLFQEVFYGVMGIDGNPQLHPHAAIDAIGRSCNMAVDCGDPYGNVCLDDYYGGERRCGAVAISESACPAGGRLRDFGHGYLIVGSACVAD